MINLTNESFKDEVLAAEGVVLVDFYADWCNPCKMLAPIVADIEKEMSAVKFCKLNVDEAMELSREYKVVNIPTLIIFSKGEIRERLIGIHSKAEIIEKLNSVL